MNDALPATSSSSAPASQPAAPPAAAFDAAFWKRVNHRFDEALDLDAAERDALMATLTTSEPDLARELTRLLDRAGKPFSALHETQTLQTALVRPGLTTELATVLGAPARPSASFDGLLHRALSAERRSAAPSRRTGDRYGPWKLRSVIGSGGMGEVWLADRADGLFDARAAIKFLRPEANVTAFVARFAQERALLARLNHPGIARLLDAGLQGGLPFLVLEYVEGLPLLNYIVEHAPLLEDRLKLFRGIVEAVSYAHSQLVVHRDLKPSNVMVTPSGQVKLLDFGVAGLLADDDDATESAATKIGGRGLTVEYAAPEQIEGEATGVASDVFSLGALGYHLLSGRRAHLPDKPGRAALEFSILHGTPEKLSLAAKNQHRVTARDNIPPPNDKVRIDADLDAIFARALRRDPEARYRTADEFLSDLRRHAERRPISARREDRTYQLRLWLRRNWLTASLGTTLFLALSGGLAASLWQADRAKAEAVRANRVTDYLVKLFNGADPDVHGGNWPNAMDLLNQAYQGMASEFANDPRSEQVVGFQLATTLRRLSRFQEAKPIIERVVSLSHESYGPQAEETRKARVLQADVMYWLDETAAALPVIEETLKDANQFASTDWYREARLLRANMLAELSRYADSHAAFDAYLALIAARPDAAWLRAEAEADRALLLGREGRRAEALAIHQEYRPIFLNPPAHAKRVALNALINGVDEQLAAGDPREMEKTLDYVVTEWERLAGKQSAHTVSALANLAFFHGRFGDQQQSLALYRERSARLQADPHATLSAKTQASLDTLEVQIQRSSSDLAQVGQALSELWVATANDPQNPPNTRDLLRRMANAGMNLGRTDLAEAYFKRFPPTPLPDPAIRLSAEPGETATRAAFALLNNQAAVACDQMSSIRAPALQKLNAYSRTISAVRAALYCTLANDDRRTAHLDTAKTTLPAQLPPAHRLRRVLSVLQSATPPTSDAATLELQKKLSAASYLGENIGRVASHHALVRTVF